ncbi:MAG: transcription-repair coupling factor [Bacilli bacterium]|nr:transcription-repair coupling factor [Bacilli bacterium]
MNILNDLLILDEYNYYSGLTKELKGLLTYKLLIEKKNSIVFLTSSLYEANEYYQIISNYTKDVLLFPMDDFLTSEAIAASPELEITRLETLFKIDDNPKIIITNLMGYLRFLPTREIYNNSIINLKIGNSFDIKKLINNLYKIGYSRETIVNKTGEMAVRGFVIDVFPLGNDNPIRIEFWGDEIDSIKEFNVDSQLTIKNLDSIKIYPCTEFLVDNTQSFEKSKQRDLIKYYFPGNVRYFLGNNSILVVDEYNNLKNNYELLFEEMNEYKATNDIDQSIKFMHDFEIDVKNTYYLYKFDEAIAQKHFNFDSAELLPLSGNAKIINDTLNNYVEKGYKVILCLNNRRQINKLIDILNNNNIIVTDINNIFDNKINIIVKNICYGFKFDKYIVYSEHELFNSHEKNVTYNSNFKYGQKIRDINKLKIGDYVVHNIHGVGRYAGIKTLSKNGILKDYLQIEYRDGDKLYIPVEKMELISKYSANDSIVPKINKLGGTEWQKTKLRIRKHVEDIAYKLLNLYAQRENTIGFKYQKDDEMQLEFEKEFIYEETKDQLKVTEEIKKDMESSRPMDRLLCGDVGYGKTEVAFRAIFKAILSGKQVAFLCPTTILSLQHFNSAQDRFKNFPVRIELMNRFISQKKQKEIIKDLKEKKIDLLIGTHRILSNDIEFADLGLLIIDEEQRFGVKHKEKIKELKNSIDILTLSATPIPRTLQMSLSGIRSLSLIETPPRNRYPVQTYVLAYNKQVIKEAIYKELARNGQAFILFNNIKDMDVMHAEINGLVPEAKIVCAHGQMSKNELENVMNDFQNREYDVMLCTTIIETGIDIPTVNTLIIIDADHFGLSQLYQIRGRVGRSNKIAYCYLMYNPGKVLSDVATKRLNVIKEFTELGSGFAIATRDLSIRGAGDILGSEQAGFIDTVGIELYLKMLNEEINRIKGIKVEEEETSEVPLIDVATTISDDYVEEEELKIEIHKKISNIKTIDDIEKIKFELEDRFGKLSDELIIYMYEEIFEHKARSLNITKVVQTKNSIILYLPRNLSEKIDGDLLFSKCIDLSRKIRFGMKNKELLITLDLINLDKHFIYYLIDILDITATAIKKV